MQTYRVYYQKPETFHKTMGCDVSYITLKDMNKTHVYLMETCGNDLEDLFQSMQGENWSPNGEAREMISGKGLQHTSMSVGDVVHEVETDRWFVVDMAGFKELQ